MFRLVSRGVPARLRATSNTWSAYIVACFAWYRAVYRVACKRTATRRAFRLLSRPVPDSNILCCSSCLPTARRRLAGCKQPVTQQNAALCRSYLVYLLGAARVLLGIHGATTEGRNRWTNRPCHGSRWPYRSASNILGIRRETVARELFVSPSPCVLLLLRTAGCSPCLPVSWLVTAAESILLTLVAKNNDTGPQTTGRQEENPYSAAGASYVYRSRGNRIDVSTILCQSWDSSWLPLPVCWSVKMLFQLKSRLQPYYFIHMVYYTV